MKLSALGQLWTLRRLVWAQWPWRRWGRNEHGSTTSLCASLLIALTPFSSAAQLDTARYARLVDMDGRSDIKGMRALGDELDRAPGMDNRQLAVLARALADYRSDHLSDCAVRVDSLERWNPPPDPRIRATVCRFRAGLLMRAGDTNAGLSELTEGLAMTDSLPAPHERVFLLVMKAELLFDQAGYNEAQALLRDAQELAERTGFLRGQCMVRINMGNLKRRQRRLEAAWADYEQALDMATAGGFDRLAETCVSNMGMVAYAMGNLDVALAYFQNLLPRIGADQPAFRARLLARIGYTLTLMENHGTALLHFNRSIALHDSLGDAPAAASVRWDRAESLWAMGQRAKAISELVDASAVLRKTSEPARWIGVESQLSEWYEEVGDEGKALRTARVVMAVRDSLSRARYNDRLALGEALFETERKAHRIAEQEQALRLAEEEARRRNIQRIALGAGLLAVAVIAVLLLRALRNRRRLAQKDRELHEQRVNELRRESELKAMHALMEGQDKERDRLSKELHDHLGSRISAIKFQVDSLMPQAGNAHAHQHQKVTRMLDDAVGEVRRISHDLAAVKLSRTGLKKALEELCESVRVKGALEVELSVSGLEQRMPGKVEMAIYRIVQELVNNTLKHAQATELSISVIREDDRFSLLLSDNGRGFDAQAMPDGIGLDNVRARATGIGATVIWDSTPGMGTTVTVEGPVPA